MAKFLLPKSQSLCNRSRCFFFLAILWNYLSLDHLTVSLSVSPISSSNFSRNKISTSNNYNQTQQAPVYNYYLNQSQNYFKHQDHPYIQKFSRKLRYSNNSPKLTSTLNSLQTTTPDIRGPNKSTKYFNRLIQIHSNFLVQNYYRLLTHLTLFRIHQLSSDLMNSQSTKIPAELQQHHDTNNMSNNTILNSNLLDHQLSPGNSLPPVSTEDSTEMDVSTDFNSTINKKRPNDNDHDDNRPSAAPPGQRSMVEDDYPSSILDSQTASTPTAESHPTPLDLTKVPTTWLWKELMERVQVLNNYRYAGPTFAMIEERIGPIPYDKKEMLQIQRDSFCTTDSASKIQFEEWLKLKQETDIVTQHQLHTILQMIKILHFEHNLDITTHIERDRDYIAQLLAPRDSPASLWLQQNGITALFADCLQLLSRDLGTLITATWTALTQDAMPLDTLTTALDEHLTLLNDLILIDSPSLALSYQEHSNRLQTLNQLEAHNLTPISFSHNASSQHTPQHRATRTTSALTDYTPADNIISHQLFSTARPVSLGAKKAAQGVTLNLRHNPAYMYRYIQSGTDHLTKASQADESTRYGQYVILNGFFPCNWDTGKAITLSELRHIGTHLGVKFDEAYIDQMYESNDWAIQRHAESIGNTPGFLLRLQHRTLFGSFKISTTGIGSIVPLTAMVKGTSTFKSRTYFTMGVCDPDDLRGIILGEQHYPTLFVIRALPFDRDLNTLTSLSINTIRAFLDVYCAGQYTICSILLHHDVSVTVDTSGRRNEEHYRYSEHHDPNDTTVKHVREPVLDIIYTGEQHNSSSTAFQTLRTTLLTKIRESISNPPHSTQPYLFRYGGLIFEVLESLNDCQSLLRRHPYTKAIQGIVLLDVPANSLALDCLLMLHRTSHNDDLLRKVELAAILPQVPRTNPPVPWRCLLLGHALNYSHSELDIIQLNMLLQEAAPDSTLVTKKSKLVSGYETSLKLHNMYEAHFGSHDQWTTTDNPIHSENSTTPPVQIRTTTPPSTPDDPPPSIIMRTTPYHIATTASTPNLSVRGSGPQRLSMVSTRTAPTPSRHSAALVTPRSYLTAVTTQPSQDLVRRAELPDFTTLIQQEIATQLSQYLATGPHRELQDQFNKLSATTQEIGSTMALVSAEQERSRLDTINRDKSITKLYLQTRADRYNERHAELGTRIHALQDIRRKLDTAAPKPQKLNAVNADIQSREDWIQTTRSSLIKLRDQILQASQEASIDPIFLDLETHFL